MSPPPGQVPGLVARAAAGDRTAIVELLERYRPRLRRMVALRLDPRLRGRVDASDVIEEGYLDAMRRLEEFIRDPAVPFTIWLRFLVLRHFEQMTNGDAAAALGLSFKAASKRYTRAPERLETILKALPGDTSESGP